MKQTLLIVFAVLAVGCGGEAVQESPSSDTSPPSSIGNAFAACTGGDLEDGIAALDAQIERSPDAPDPRVLRGLCYWTRWDETGEEDDARQAYYDLTAAIDALEDGGEANTPLDRIYSYRAFVAHAIDDQWERTVEDLGRAARLAPRNATHAIDHGVARSYIGDTVGARRELQRFLVLTNDSTESQRRDLAESLLADLEGASATE